MVFCRSISHQSQIRRATRPNPPKKQQQRISSALESAFSTPFSGTQPFFSSAGINGSLNHAFNPSFPPGGNTKSAPQVFRCSSVRELGRPRPPNATIFLVNSQNSSIDLVTTLKPLHNKHQSPFQLPTSRLSNHFIGKRVRRELKGNAPTIINNLPSLTRTQPLTRLHLRPQTILRQNKFLLEGTGAFHSLPEGIGCHGEDEDG